MPLLKMSKRYDRWWSKLNFKKLEKEIQITWSRDRPRLLLFENCNQRCPALTKRITPFSLYQNIDPTKCLRNHLWMVRIAVPWCSLTSASPPLTKNFRYRNCFLLIPTNAWWKLDALENWKLGVKGNRLNGNGSRKCPHSEQKQVK